MEILYCIGAFIVAGLGALLWIRIKQYRLGRAVSNGEVSLVADIDAIRTKPYALKLFDRIHVLEPMPVVRFENVAAALAQLGKYHESKATEKEVFDGYAKLFEVTVPTITADVMGKMTTAQIAQVYNVILGYLAGTAHIEAEKKSPQLDGRLSAELNRTIRKHPKSRSISPSYSQRSVASTGGVLKK